MEMKHTPGPWFIQEGKYYACVRTDKRVIADMRTVGNVVPNMNDARLIAAAPDLLEAVQVCLKAEKERCKNLLPGAPATTYCDKRIAMIEATIAKATGEDE